MRICFGALTNVVLYLRNNWASNLKAFSDSRYYILNQSNTMNHVYLLIHIGSLINNILERLSPNCILITEPIWIKLNINDINNLFILDM